MNKQQLALVKRHIGLDVWEGGKARAQKLLGETLAAERKLTAVQWAWGDLCVEIVPMTLPGGDTRLTGQLIDAFLEDYDCPYKRKSLMSIRTTCAQWPREKRTLASFFTHQILAHTPNRFDLIRDDLLPEEARELAGHRHRERGSSVTPIGCANAAKSWARALSKRIEGDPSEDLIVAASDAWVEMAAVIDKLGMLDDLIEEYYAEDRDVYPELAAA